jgi:hypothetical protein
LLGMWMVDDLEKLWTNLWQTISIKKLFSTRNVTFAFSIVIDHTLTAKEAEASMNRTLCGIKINWSDKNENGDDSIRINREFDSNETDESK